ncbi:hypothetical protein BCR42DRAFT_492833 [Absidia repens]|uniref:C3H1-type domain-containing protein n=1 Tax=Absidia repens TaxID=90262 RepID=A0A1X2IDA5_9FUNG|nr:hypothetical protein BCR42DRAFT_492833 [Absidia repens]
MTDSSRLHSNWKTPFLFSPHDGPSLEDLTLLASSKCNSTTTPLPRPLPSSSPYQTQVLRHTSFQPFDPFNADILENTSAKDADLDELSNFLSRQFLDDVDADTLPTTKNISSITTSVSIQSYSPTDTAWRLDGGEKIRKPWSPSFHATSHLTSSSTSSQTTLLSQQDDDTDNTNGGRNTNISNSRTNELLSTPSPPTATWWDRYGNDSEFDPTLPFYQGDQENSSTAVDLPGTINSATCDNNRRMELDGGDNGKQQQRQQQPQELDMTMVALKKLATLFPHLDEKELGQTLAALDYDIERTIETLLPAPPSPQCGTAGITSTSTTPPAIMSTVPATVTATATATGPKVHLIKSPIPSTSPPLRSPTQPAVPAAAATAISLPKKRQVCRHYLAGDCYRKDCWFAHDLDVKPCKFWLQGSCLKGDTCEFAHSLKEMEQVADYHQQQQQYQQISNSSGSGHHHSSQLDHRQQCHHQQQDQHYTPTTVVEFPILIARSNRKSKKSHNKKKSFKKLCVCLRCLHALMCIYTVCVCWFMPWICAYIDETMDFDRAIDAPRPSLEFGRIMFLLLKRCKLRSRLIGCEKKKNFPSIREDHI